MESIGQFVHGKRQAGDGSVFLTSNPATGATLAEVTSATGADVARAVESCAEGQRIWARATPAHRARVLFRAAGLIRDRLSEIAAFEVADTGKPISEAEAYDIPSAAEAFEFFASAAATLHGQHVDLGAADGGAYFYTRREPLGICGGIGAWNYPFQIAAWKAAPALAAGNAMLFKPSELTPVTALLLGEILIEAGLPPGCFNVVQGDAEIGRALTGHPALAKVSLTGETATGRLVMAAAAATLKHVTVELGGKSPLLIFPDANLDSAVHIALAANYFSQGEVCTNGTRVFVHESIREAFVAKATARIASLRLGDPMSRQTNMGALISAEHKERVEAFVADGIAAGAVPHYGPEVPRDEPFASGFFVRPVLFDRCEDEMRIAREEIFGPVMSLLVFSDENEAIERANATDYGLAAAVVTRDLARAHRVVAQLDAGVCWINTYNVTPVEMPFGGVKQSGLGRENGLACLEHYTRTKSVYVELGETGDPWPDAGSS